ncbi:MAG: hypothetical protein LBO63_04425 [Oscillospiraceae bacterium]|jgi:hypothetical protein|nr:hypothetical protein [Oscillospiraceae bacterium]
MSYFDKLSRYSDDSYKLNANGYQALQDVLLEAFNLESTGDTFGDNALLNSVLFSPFQRSDDLIPEDELLAEASVIVPDFDANWDWSKYLDSIDEED